MPTRPCLTCGALSPGSYCAIHAKANEAKRNARRAWYSGDWERKSRQARAAWVAEHGPLCPGWQRGPHMVRPDQLTLDHIDPRTAGAGFQVLCRSCNSRKG